MNLKIEDGILLKPHALARHTDGYSPPPAGWTPEDMYDVNRLTANLALASDGTLEALKHAKVEAWLTIEKKHYDANEPWAGWVPTTYQTDRRIGRAYRNLFVEMNGGQCPPKRDKHAKYPPDGMYEYRNGKMSLLPKDEDS